jgi:tetratricopeptide (TPR) repeat protein
MCWPNRRRWLPALAAIVFGVPAVFSQTPTPALPEAPSQIPTEIPVQNTPQTLDAIPSQAPAAAPQSSPVAVVPATPSTPEEVGDSMMSHQRYQAAVEAFKKDPHPSADIWNKMGIAYQMLFNLEEASRCYQASLRLNPKNPRVMNNLGTIYDSEKGYRDAERMYRKALRFDPQSALIYKNLGTNLLAQHKYKKGWEEYKTALQIDPGIFENTSSPRVQNPASVEDRGAMNYYMAKGCVRAGMNDCAIEYLRMALNEGFTNPKKIQADSEFAALKGMPAFEQLLAAQKQQ